MATIGLSKPYFAKYSHTGSKVTYTGGTLLGKYTELSIELDSKTPTSCTRTTPPLRATSSLPAARPR